MKLSDYIKRSGVTTIELAKKIGGFQGDISAYANGKRPVPPKRAVQIELATNGEVTRKDLRPDDWHEIWIELK